MVAMLVSNQDRGEGLRSNADPFQALEGLFAAQPGVNQKTGLRGRQQCGVPGTGRRKYPTLNDKPLPKTE
jgi:hypothetical protein